MVSYPTSQQQRLDAKAMRAYDRETWLNVTIQLHKGNPVTLNIRGSLHLMSHIAKEMKATGYVTLWNDNECVMLDASNVAGIYAVKLTTEGE